MNHIIRGIVNGEKKTLSELGLEGKTIKSVWTILDEEKLFTKYDSKTGKQYKISNLQEVIPIHWKSAFVEDKIHDYSVDCNNVFSYYAHSSEKGEKVDLFIITTD